MSFTRSGQIFFTDSGEGGEAGYAPFTDGRGAWRCLGGGKARATTLDFTLPAAGESKSRIGRLDMDFSYDAKNKTITGTGVLYFVPLTANPMQASELKDGRDFKLTGQPWRLPRGEQRCLASPWAWHEACSVMRSAMAGRRKMAASPSNSSMSRRLRA
jgi:hypothetical protein